MKGFFTEIEPPSPLWDMIENSEVTGQPISVLNRLALSQAINHIFMRKKVE